MTPTTAPRLLAAGESQARTYTHVGYSVIQFTADVSDYRRVAPHTVEGSVLLALMLLAWGSRHAPRLRELVGRFALALVAGLAVVALQVPLRPFANEGLLDLRVHWTMHPVLWGVLLCVLASLAQSQPDRVGRVAVGAAGVIVLGAALTAPALRSLKPVVLSDLLQLEQLSASTEAQAARLGHWPTPAEWQTEHGRPVGVDGSRFEYGPATRLPDPYYVVAPNWRRYTVVCQPPGPPANNRRFLSEEFGADGLFATGDDPLQYKLPPSRFGRAEWPHARAPRDPNVKLPPWPAAPNEVKP
ncbi:MAG: hypothetical protein HZB16_06270 [Armatimonadetes bacterium]|nr:hypothetical protein [Armatimonadota bacterium]